MSKIRPRLDRATVLILLLTTLALGACGTPATDDDENGALSVVATTGMIGDLARQIAAEDASVVALMGPGIDPHLYKASESDVRRLAGADLILYNGLYLEGKMGDILVKMARDRPVVAVTEQVPPDALREPPELAGHYDPHLWFDVALWSQAIDPVVAALSEVVPAKAEIFRTRGETLRNELLALDAWVAERIAEIPEAQRVLVTAHDAFGYFGDRYDIEVIGLQGISTLAEAGLQDVDRVVELVVQRGIKAMFVESSVPRRSIEAVQQACAAQGHEVTIGGELFSDAMGAAGTPEGTYDGMVRSNVDTIVEALK